MGRVGRMIIAGVVLVGLVIAVLLVAFRGDDGQRSVRLPALGDATGKIGGAAFLDNGDGTLGDGDSPIAGADVYAGYFSTRFAGDEFHTTTAADGSFVLSLPEGSAQLTNLFVEVALATESPNGTPHRSAISRRVAVTVGTRDALVSFTSLPARCGESPLPACGAPLLPDLQPVLDGVSTTPDLPLPADSWSVDTITQPGRRLLRFSSVTANVGDGPLHAISNVAPGSTVPTTEVWQRVWYEGLGFSDRPLGTFLYDGGTGHRHIHVADFEEYRLLDAGGKVVATHQKVSFCLMDNLQLHDATTPDVGVYRPSGECGSVEQSINPGWTDYYAAPLFDQWIDVTDLPPGSYSVEIVADPDDLILEMDETNNSVRFPVIIPNP